MQLLGIGSLLLCVLCMFLVYIELQLAAEIIFGIALVYADYFTGHFGAGNPDFSEGPGPAPE